MGIRGSGYPGSYPAGTRVVKIPGFESSNPLHQLHAVYANNFLPIHVYDCVEGAYTNYFSVFH
jgi:hypothetical protein